MERSDMDGRKAIARRGQPDGWIKIRLCGPELLNPVPRMRHASKTFRPSVSEKIFGNGSIP